MEIIIYSDREMVVDPNNGAAVLAARLLALNIDSVSIYSNVVTVTCEPEVFSKIKTDVDEILENLFRFYGENAGWSNES